MSKHTPGKWLAEGTRVFRGESGPTIADTEFGGRNPEINKANARLIAAAPDLLEALERCESLLSTFTYSRPKSGHNLDAVSCLLCGEGGSWNIYHRDDCAIMEFRTAIARARGEE